MSGGGGRGSLGGGGLGGVGGGMEGTSGRIRGMGAGGRGGGSGVMSEADLGPNPHQRYEMLKLHQTNLLNQIKETTFMMNLYQQYFLQQEEQKKSMSNEGLGSEGPKSGMASGGILGGYGGRDIGRDDMGSGLGGTSGVMDAMNRRLRGLGATGGGMGTIDRLLSRRSEMDGMRDEMGGVEGGMMGTHTVGGGLQNEDIIGGERGDTIGKGGGSRSGYKRGRGNLIGGFSEDDMMAELQGGERGNMVGKEENENLSRVEIRRRQEGFSLQNSGRSSQQKPEQDEGLRLQNGRRSFKQQKGLERHNKGQESQTYQCIGVSGEQEERLRKIQEEIAQRRRQMEALMAAYTTDDKSGSDDMRRERLGIRYGTGEDEPPKRAKTA